MLIDINLLPKKEKKKKTYIFILTFLILILIFGIIFSYFYLRQMNNELDTLNREIQLTNELNTIYRSNFDMIKVNTDYNQLSQTIKILEEQGVSHVFILEKLVENLPSRGYWLNYSDDGVSTINLRVQFDSPQEVAYYIENLLDISWVEDVLLTDVRQITRSYGDVEFTRVNTNITIKYNQEKIKETFKPKDGE